MELQGRRKILSRRLFHFVKFYLSVCINMCVCWDTRKKLINSWIKHNSSLSCRAPHKIWITFLSMAGLFRSLGNLFSRLWSSGSWEIYGVSLKLADFKGYRFLEFSHVIIDLWACQVKTNFLNKFPRFLTFSCSSKWRKVMWSWWKIMTNGEHKLTTKVRVEKSQFNFEIKSFQLKSFWKNDKSKD